MPWNVQIVEKVQEVGNVGYSQEDILKQALGKDFTTLDGQPCGDVAKWCTDAVKYLVRSRDDYSNRWNEYIDAIITLSSIANACMETPDGKVELV